jgi:HD-like signal output (HDOD) protein
MPPIAQLGLSLEQIGRATAEHWGLPRNLIAGMRRVEPGERGADFGHDDWLAALGTMSSQCAEIRCGTATKRARNR